jgi:hypothetical protein
MPGRSPLRVRSATRPGGPVDQDRHLLLRHAVIVLGGASDSGRDGGRYADALGAALAAALTATPAADLAQALEGAIASVAAALPVASGASSSVAVVRWVDGVLDALVLGDAKVIAVLPAPNLLEDLTPWGGASTREVELCDLRIADVAPDLRLLLRRRLHQGGTFDEGHAALLADIRAEERKARNVSGGYWTAATDPAAARHALTGRWPLDGLVGVTLATDGAWRGFSQYRMHPDPTYLVLRPDRFDPGTALDLIHQKEAADPDGRRWPRSSRHDDKTLVIVTHA